MSVQLLMERLTAEPSRVIALSDADVAVSAADLLRQVAAIRTTLPDLGGRWALFFEDSIACLAHVLAVWEAGGQPCLAPNNLPATCAAMSHRVDGFLGDFPVGTQASANADSQRSKVATGTEPAISFFTSGSSGAPQCVEKNARQLFNEVETLERCFGERLGDSLVVSSVSHQHIYGFLFRLLWPVMRGRVFTAENLRYTETLTHYPAKQLIWVTSPTHLTRLPPTVNEPRVATIFSSGAPLPESASCQAASQFDAQVVEVFGSTETGGIGWRCQHLGERAWRPLPGVAVRADAQGILLIQSPHLQDQNWHRCDDRAELVGQNFLLLGRVDRIAKVEGKRVSLEQLEQALLAHHSLVDVRIESYHRQGQVAGRDELLVIAVLSDAGVRRLTENRRALIAELKATLAAVVERPLLPRRWRFVDQLPRNTQGKLEHHRLQQLVRELLTENSCG
ncbi:AMP-binding protein [Simiduia agarivorans]|uniref:Acyl-CoA synthetase n=1 Tax=Simiduia agarivorans (strain DSM 21679 / JCM 13881 / BCRC 17597 / SA1) TaxID=1117647 RepID=K4KXD0_SIMAS|nr:AMP-binding protein [Simiduia agarivorans]AFU98592.1 acyl-CoA synthetase [Simiduia agarivorans SA1 = DSM 21679]